MEGIVKENLKGAKILEPMPEKGAIEALQHHGVVVFDQKGTANLSSYQRAQKKVLQETLSKLYATISFKN